MKLNTNLRFLEFGVITRWSIHDFEWLLFFQFQYWWYMFYYYWGTSSKYIAKNTQFLFRDNLLMQLTQRSATRLHYYKKNFLKIWLVIPKILKILNIGSKINSVARISYFNPVNKELSFFFELSLSYSHLQHLYYPTNGIFENSGISKDACVFCAKIYLVEL